MLLQLVLQSDDSSNV